MCITRNDKGYFLNMYLKNKNESGGIPSTANTLYLFLLKQQRNAFKYLFFFINSAIYNPKAIIIFFNIIMLKSSTYVCTYRFIGYILVHPQMNKAFKVIKCNLKQFHIRSLTTYCRIFFATSFNL